MAATAEKLDRWLGEGTRSPGPGGWNPVLTDKRCVLACKTQQTMNPGIGVLWSCAVSAPEFGLLAVSGYQPMVTVSCGAVVFSRGCSSQEDESRLIFFSKH